MADQDSQLQDSQGQEPPQPQQASAAESAAPLNEAPDNAAASAGSEAGQEAAATAAAAAPAPATAPEPAQEPQLASTIELPAALSSPSSEPSEGGEWELLVAKVRTWLSSGAWRQQWQAARTPLSLTAGLIALLVVLRVYTALLSVLDSLPLVPGLLELAGVVAVVRFGLTNLLRSSDREQVISTLRNRWAAFRGRR